MAEPTTDHLITSLTTNLKPTPPLAGAAVRASTWLCVAAVIVLGEMVAATTFGLKISLVATPANCASTVAVAAALIVAALAAFREAVPGSDTRKLRFVLFAGLLPLWLAFQLASLLAEPAGMDSLRTEMHGAGTCSMFIFGFALTPAILVYAMLRRGAPTQAARCGALALLAGTAAGALGMQVLCPGQEAAHLILWHILPTFVLGFVGYGVGKLVLRW